MSKTVACEGTALEKRTVKAKKKAFLFLGTDDAMLKLRDRVVTNAPPAAPSSTRPKTASKKKTRR